MPSAVSNRVFASARKMIYFTASSTAPGSVSIPTATLVQPGDEIGDIIYTTQTKEEAQASFEVRWALHCVSSEHWVDVALKVALFELGTDGRADFFDDVVRDGRLSRFLGFSPATLKTDEGKIRTQC